MNDLIQQSVEFLTGRIYSQPCGLTYGHRFHGQEADAGLRLSGRCNGLFRPPQTPIVVSDGKGAVLWTGECYFVRGRVINSGKTRAEKVQVYAEKLAKEGLDGKFADVPTFLPLHCKWSNSPPGGASSVLDGVSPKIGAFFDIVGLCDPKNPHQTRPEGSPSNTTIAELQLEVAPLTGSNLLPPGRYRVTLRIAAANAEPIEKIFDFKHSGEWRESDPDMRRDCMGISLT